MKASTLHAWAAVLGDDETPEQARKVAEATIIDALDDIAMTLDQAEKDVQTCTRLMNEAHTLRKEARGMRNDADEALRKRQDLADALEKYLREGPATTGREYRSDGMRALGRHYGLSVFGSDWMDVLSKLDGMRAP